MRAGTEESAQASTGPVREPTSTGLEVTSSFPTGATSRDVLAVIASCGCPFCRQPVGKYCRDLQTGRLTPVHATRVRAAQRRGRRGAR